MLFASLDFLLFFVPIFGLFWLLRDHPLPRTLLLLAASYFFYMAGSRPPDGGLPPHWTFAGLLAFSTVLDWFVGKGLHALAPGLDSGDPGEIRRSQRRRRALLMLSLGGNLGLLGYFKYTNFFLSAFVDLANLWGAGWIAPHLKLVLPVGISFYTFQTLSYSIDVYRRRLEPETHFARFALFVVLFPQLVAGPIVRASELLPQLRRRPKLSLADLDEGLFRIIKGLIKKVVLGDWIASNLADFVFDTPEAYTSLENLIALYAFTLQIYADFSGYSDIAIGVARLLGLRLPENFDRPYQSRDVGEFWRRWHITLSTWLRDYLFFPLGGSKLGPVRTYVNLWLTMFLVGMWHGASWNFVVYSNIHALAMVFNRWNRLRDRSGPWLGRVAMLLVVAAAVGGAASLFAEYVMRFELSTVRTFGLLAGGGFFALAVLPVTGGRLNTALHIFLTFHFTVISRIFFRAEDFERARTMCLKLLNFEWLGFRTGLFRVQQASAWLELNGDAMAPWIQILRPALVWCAEYGLGIVLVFGIAYHFTPARWVERGLRRTMARLPGPVVGVLLAAVGILLVVLLSGPRANIYFEF